MDEELYTQNAARPDLAAIEVNPPEGYIADKLMPVVTVYQMTGKLDYHAKVADSSAQTGRSASTKPTATQIAQSQVDFSCSETMKRGAIAPAQVPLMGGIEKADQIGARFAKRSVMAWREEEVAKLVLRTPDASFDVGAVVAQAAAARAASKGIAGKLCLVGAAETLAALFMDLVTEASTSALLSRIVSGTAPGVAMAGLDPAAQAKAVATLFGCQDVHVGDDAIWNGGDLAGRFAVGRFDDGAEGNHLFEPVFGRQIQYQPQGGSPITMRSTADTTDVQNYYDAFVYVVPKVLNSSGIYVFGGVSA